MGWLSRASGGVVMKLLGFQIPNFTFPGVTDDKLFDHVVMLAKTAEQSGFDSVFVMDHLYQIPVVGPRTDPMLEGYTVLPGIAPRTRNAPPATPLTALPSPTPALLPTLLPPPTSIP